MRSRFAGSVAVALTIALGCSSNDRNKAARPPASFATDSKPSGATVFLRGRPRDTRDQANSGDDVRVDVVARGIDRAVHGAAFRLHWDPTLVRFGAAQGSDAWSRQALFLAKEGMPGELVVAWTEKGSAPGIDANSETVLGWLDFTMRTRDGAALEFRPDRSTLRDASGTPLTVEWRGGRVAP